MSVCNKKVSSFAYTSLQFGTYISELVVIELERTSARSALARVAVFAVMLALYCVFDTVGLVNHSTLWITPVLVLLFTLFATVAYFKPHIEERFSHHRSKIKPLLCVLLVMICLFLLERPYVEHLVITLPYILLNLCILGVCFAIVFFAGQQTRGAAVFVLAICFLFGIANYFLIQFKGQPVMPADLFALETAAAVWSGYVYAINDSVALAYTGLAAGLLLVMFLPKPKIDNKRITANVSTALACIFAFGVWFSATDIEEDYKSWFYMFRPQLSYADYGSMLCFLSLVQQITPDIPDNYSFEFASDILTAYASPIEPLKASVDNPSVVVVMNETFADLSSFEGLSEVYAGPQFYQSIDDATLKGNAFVSVLGGGTCNSEFELLTGASMSGLGSGYPYMNYDLSKAGNLVSQFKSFGYDTTAIHPDKATNWKRNVVYEDFGFDEFYDQSYFEDAETIRGFTRDKETYDQVLDVLKNNDEPQFIFDVTIQNHGGYSKGGIPEDMQVSAPINGVVHPELDEYLSSVNQSDADLQYLIESLEAIEEPVVLCFFGDHQPNVMNWLWEYLGYENLENASVAELQDFYTVPYMIWTNYDVDEAAVDSLFKSQNMSPGDVIASSTQTMTEKDRLLSNDTDDQTSIVSAGVAQESQEAKRSTFELDMSLNYLGAFTTLIADQPLDSYQQFLIDSHAEMPGINVNGFMSADGEWHDFDDETALFELRKRYEIVQYQHLFGAPK